MTHSCLFPDMGKAPVNQENSGSGGGVIRGGGGAIKAPSSNFKAFAGSGSSLGGSTPSLTSTITSRFGGYSKVTQEDPDERRKRMLSAVNSRINTSNDDHSQ